MRRDFFIYLVSGNTEPSYSGQAQQQSKACAVRKVAKHCADLEKYYFRDRAQQLGAWLLPLTGPSVTLYPARRRHLGLVG